MAKAHFRIFGVPVRVEPFFVIVAALFGINIEPLWVVFAFVVIVFVSVLFHEMGHALTYRALGQRSAIVLHGFGGFTVPTGGGRRVLSKGKAVAVSVSGALTQLLVLGIPARIALESNWGDRQGFNWALDGYDGFSWWPILYWLQLVSIWWAVFNLLPIRPLDGGHVAETLVGFENACRLSIAAAIVAGFVTFRDGRFGLIGLLYFGFFAYVNFRDLREGQSSGTFDVDAPEGRPGGGRPGRGRRRGRSRANLSVVPPRDAVPDLTPKLSSGEAETRAWNALRSGDSARAASVMRHSGSPGSAFLQASITLAAGGPVEMVDDLFEAAYTAEPGGPPNLVPATLLADHGRAVPVAARLVASGRPGVEAAGGLQTHLHYAERFRPAAEVGEQVFAAGPQSPAQTAFEVSCSWARAGSPEEALRWIEAAVDAGFHAPGVLDGEPDLASVRALPGWAAVRARLSA
ncbi:MAG TPA: site-2 protease family protein [Acidimicrobiales bacterium]|nr:site-2 protease family protein [Acidimicrobiales bacterium]